MKSFSTPRRNRSTGFATPLICAMTLCLTRPLNFPMTRWRRTESAKTFGLFIDGRLASSIRLHTATPVAPLCPALSVFPDCLRPMLSAGMTVIDPTRFVVDDNFARRYRKLPHATIRLAWMACEHESATMLLATAGAEHQAFYRRLFGHRVISEPRPYPTLSTPVSLMAVNFLEERERVTRRYPFLRSSECERNAIFGSQGGFGTTKSPKPNNVSALTPGLNSGQRGGRQFDPSQFPAVA